MRKYAICRHGDRITAKRTDKVKPFEGVLTYRDTLQEARLCAKVERMVLARWHEKYTLPIRQPGAV
jgi:hypothetical protein